MAFDLKALTLNTVGMATNLGGHKDPTARESQSARENRMKAFWASPDNQELWRVRQILANKERGKTLAAHLIQGEAAKPDSIKTPNGTVLPLQPGFELSLNTIDNWGCLACHSAHGSGVWPSPSVNATNLAQNEFYYNPKTKSLFTISRHCWDLYVENLGAAQNFIEIPEPEKVAEFPQPQEPKSVQPQSQAEELASALATEKHQLLPSVTETPLTRARLGEMANSRQFTADLAKQASDQLPNLLRTLETYVNECARREGRSVLLLIGNESPSCRDQVRCPEAVGTGMALNRYLRDFSRVVTPAGVRTEIVRHFSGLGIRTRLVRNPQTVKSLHLIWIFYWFIPRDTVEISW